MSLSETARLLASFEAKDGLSPVIGKMTHSLDHFDARVGKSGTRAYKAGQQIGTGIKSGIALATGAVAASAGLLVLMAHEGQKAQNVQIKFDQAVKNSGKVSADYTKILDAQTTALSNMTGADDEAIKSVQTMLVTQGLTGKQVEQITPLVLAAATQTGRDMDAVALAVGRAVQGSATSLGKLGIIVPKAAKATKSAALASLELEQKQLALAKANALASGSLDKNAKASFAHKKAVLDAAVAQQKLTDSQKKGTKAASGFKTVFNTLNQKFKGVNEALAGQFDTKLKAFNERLQDIRENAGIKLLPALTKIVDIVNAKLLPAFSGFIDAILPSFIAGLDHLSEFLSSGGAVSTLDSLVSGMKTAAPILATAAQTTFNVVKAAVGLFASLPPEIQALAVAGLAINKLTGGLVTNLAGGLISAVISSFKGLMNVNAAVVNVNGGVVNGAGGLPGAALGAGEAAAGGIGVATLPALGLIAASVGATVIGSASVRSAVDRAIANADVASLTAQAEAARKHGVSDSNNAALKALQAIVHNTASLAAPTTGSQAGQDAAEKAQQARNSAFTSNPTRQELRVKVRDLEKLKPTKDTQRAIQSLQNRLQNRIDAEKAKIAAVTEAGTRAIVAAVKAAGGPPTIQVTVPVTTNFNSRLVEANLNRYTYLPGQGIIKTSGFLP